jgi:hypothetical protein
MNIPDPEQNIYFLRNLFQQLYILNYLNITFKVKIS